MWESNLSEWKSIPIERYKFYFEIGEKRLKEVLDEAEKITSRSYSLITITIPILSLSIAELLKNFSQPTGLTLLSVLAIILTSYILFSLIKIVNVRDVWYLGTEPCQVVNDSFNKSDTLSQEDLTKALYLSEIEQIQHKVSSNKEVNYKRIAQFKLCLNIYLISLVALITILFYNYVI